MPFCLSLIYSPFKHPVWLIIIDSETELITAANISPDLKRAVCSRCIWTIKMRLKYAFSHLPFITFPETWKHAVIVEKKLSQSHCCEYFERPIDHSSHSLTSPVRESHLFCRRCILILHMLKTANWIFYCESLCIFHWLWHPWYCNTSALRLYFYSTLTTALENNLAAAF